MVSGLATHATWARAFRPSRLPISAKVDLSGSDKRNRAGRCARNTRFSAAKYSFWTSSSWLMRPVTYASRRIHLLCFIWSDQHTPPVQFGRVFWPYDDQKVESLALFDESAVHETECQTGYLQSLPYLLGRLG